MKSPAYWLIAAAIGAFVSLAMIDASPLSWVISDVLWLALLLGAAVGALFGLFLQQGRRLRSLEDRVARFDSMRDSARPLSTSNETVSPRADTQSRSAASTAEPSKASDLPPDPEADAVLRLSPAGEPATQATQPEGSDPEPGVADAGGAPRGSAAAPSRSRGREEDRTRTVVNDLAERLGQINLPVKIGVLVLFVGLAALLRHAADQGWLSMPIELRLAGIAALGLAGLLVGWAQRLQRRVFALSLQGGAIGVLVLTVFAASRLYVLLPQPVSLAIAAVLIFGGGALAVIQRSQALALLSMLAGFAAPVLLSSGTGGPLEVYIWYALLNLAVFGVALKQHWPLLTRLGFVATFVVGGLWGVLTWQPSHYWTAQWFLILFFALYFLLPMIQARATRGLGRMDAALVFALPLLALPPQIALLVDNRLGIAFAVLVAALAYLIAATYLIRRWRLTSLGQSFAVLAVSLATLAVPFAFSGPTVVMVWALEGAALIWLGCLQQRRLARLSGLALLALATSVWFGLLFYGAPVRELFMLNAAGLGGLAIAASAWLAAWRYQEAGARSVQFNGLFATGFVVWMLNGLVEIERAFSPSVAFSTLQGLFAASLALIGWMHWRQRWAGAGLACVLLLLSSAWLALSPIDPLSPLRYFGWAAGLALLLIVLMLDRALASAQSTWRFRISLAGHVALTAYLARLGVFWADQQDLSSGWLILSAGLPLLLLAGALHLRVRPPLCLSPLALSQRFRFEAVVISLLVIVLLASLANNGDPSPLPWLPLLNPLELAQFGALALTLLFVRSFTSRAPRALVGGLSGAAVVLCLLVISAATLRSAHYFGAAAWQPAALFASDQAQASISVVWTLLGVIAWVYGSRAGKPVVWRLGAVLMGLVLLKLIMIDRHFLSNVAGILSFVAFGLLSILVGFLAPAPPSTLASLPQQAADPSDSEPAAQSNSSKGPI